MNNYYLTFGGENVRVLGFHMWNQLTKTLKTKWLFKTFKMSLGHWFVPKC